MQSNFNPNKTAALAFSQNSLETFVYKKKEKKQEDRRLLD